MPDRPKKRHKDYKRIVTMKTLDTSIYREGLPYWVKFNGDEKGKILTIMILVKSVYVSKHPMVISHSYS